MPITPLLQRSRPLPPFDHNALPTDSNLDMAYLHSRLRPTAKSNIQIPLIPHPAVRRDPTCPTDPTP